MSRPAIPYLLAAAVGCRFGLGVWVLYYLRVTNYAGIGLAEGLMILVTLIAEVPTGALADLMGRKRTLNLGFGFLSLSFLVFWQLNGLASLCLACMLFSLGKITGKDLGYFEVFQYPDVTTGPLTVKSASQPWTSSSIVGKTSSP